MSPEQQKLVRDNAFKAMVDSFEIALKQDNEYKEKLTKFGVQFITLTEAQKQVFVKRARLFWKRITSPNGETRGRFSPISQNNGHVHILECRSRIAGGDRYGPPAPCFPVSTKYARIRKG